MSHKKKHIHLITIDGVPNRVFQDGDNAKIEAHRLASENQTQLVVIHEMPILDGDDE